MATYLATCYIYASFGWGVTPAHLHAPALEMNEKQHVVGGSPRSVSTSPKKKSVPASAAECRAILILIVAPQPGANE
jgi:hypothetical protein